IIPIQVPYVNQHLHYEVCERKVLIFCIEKITKSSKQPPLILDQKSAINNQQSAIVNLQSILFQSEFRT
uniref:hypothetical protein n=1 Tax=uncultured Dokdonia sp. TaxID=575653 RepID=UPI002610032B